MNVMCKHTRAPRSVALLSLTALILLVGGCLPEKRVGWSPDGQRAFVINESGLALCDAQGALSPVLIPGVRQAAWFADSRRLVITRRREVARWRDIAALCAPEHRATLEAAAQALQAEALAYNGPIDKFEPRALKSLAGSESAAVLLYVQEHFAATLATRFGKSWDNLKDLRVNVWSVDVVDPARPADLTPVGPTASFTEMAFPRPSPDGKYAAWVQEIPGQNNTIGRLAVASVGSTSAKTVASHAGVVADWTADSRSLAYVSVTEAGSQERDKLRLGTVCMRTVRDAAGDMPAEFPPSRELAGVVVQDYHALRCLRDGRILFAAAEIHLPCTAKDMPGKVSVFAVDPDRNATVTRVLTRDAESQAPNGAALFEVSPDERRLLLPANDGEISIYTMATGELVTIPREPEADSMPLVVPSWRMQDEICMAVPKGHSWGSKERAELVLWTATGQKCISRSWSNDAVTGILSDTKPNP